MSATHERVVRDQSYRNEMVKPHMLEAGQWVLVRHESPNKFEAKWYGPYQIIDKHLLGTYRIQDPNGRELPLLIHGNRLISATISTTAQLRELWSSPAKKDQLRRQTQNQNLELVPSEPENTRELERYLLEIESNENDLEPLTMEATQERTSETEKTSESPFRVRISPKRWMEQIALSEQEKALKRRKT